MKVGTSKLLWEQIEFNRHDSLVAHEKVCNVSKIQENHANYLIWSNGNSFIIIIIYLINDQYFHLIEMKANVWIN